MESHFTPYALAACLVLPAAAHASFDVKASWLLSTLRATQFMSSSHLQHRVINM
ncbi:hypothetical protein [Pseudoalteromonas rubra]|uniref:hypothetical protein n=1 Tax=Pseudoalteromonas rubra TaxID=43658 RepID=UPI0014863318|nr:hypothetical protein [Pseudoalteromonas rubra]